MGPGGDTIKYRPLPAGATTAFQYDLLGNRQTVNDGLNGVTRSYQHDLVNQYTSATAGQITQAVVYDPRGNLSRDDGFDDVDGDAADLITDDCIQP